MAADEAAAAARAGAEGLTKLVESVVPRAELEASKIECAVLTAELSSLRQQFEETVPKMHLQAAENAVLTLDAENKRLHLQLEKTVPIEKFLAAQEESAALWYAIDLNTVTIARCVSSFQ